MIRYLNLLDAGIIPPQVDPSAHGLMTPNFYWGFA